MEIGFPWAPTAAHRRLPAVREYISGERLCDAGNPTQGVQHLRKAVSLAWELDSEDWPGWAHSLYAQLRCGAAPPPEPPVIGADTSHIQPSLASLATRRPHGVSWRQPAAIAAVRDALERRGFAIVDLFMEAEEDAGVMGAIDPRPPQHSPVPALRAACHHAYAAGVFSPAKVAKPGDGLNGERSIYTRSDYIAWVDTTPRATQLAQRLAGKGEDAQPPSIADVERVAAHRQASGRATVAECTLKLAKGAACRQGNWIQCVDTGFLVLVAHRGKERPARRQRHVWGGISSLALARSTKYEHEKKCK